MVRFFKILLNGINAKRELRTMMKTHHRTAPTPTAQMDAALRAVSSKDQEREGFSIPAQQTAERIATERAGLEFKEVETAKVAP